MSVIRRREFVTLLGGAAVAWPLAASAQQSERMRRIGVIMPASSDDPEYQVRVGAFLQELQRLGWIIGRNIRIDTRWTRGDAEDARKYAAELVALNPDVVLATGISTVASLLQLTRTVPIVFPAVSDPVAAGVVESLARPGGNATGFLAFEYSLSGKWPELLKQIAPTVRRAAILRDPATPSGIGQFGIIQAVASSVGLEVFPVHIRDAAAIENALVTLARSQDGGVIVGSSGRATLHQTQIIKLAAEHKLPAVYWDSSLVAAGGLISYGPNFLDQHRRAAGYVDRILKGEKPADLPVQTPTKYELVINLKTAKALGLEIPSSVLARADEVIE
jgi:putative tryptophan/tyrosine transport system substrate-binding protein